jgi:hypothetical protein
MLIMFLDHGAMYTSKLSPNEDNRASIPTELSLRNMSIIINERAREPQITQSIYQYHGKESAEDGSTTREPPDVERSSGSGLRRA